MFDYIFDAVFIAWGVCDLINGGYKDWKNWAALGIDLLFAAAPFVPAGTGQIIMLGNKIDNARDIAHAVNRLDNYHDAAMTTIIGRKMGRVTDVAFYLGKTEDLYQPWQYFDTAATGMKRLIHTGISVAHDGAWMLDKLRNGYTIIDIGIQSTQAGFGLYYGVEKLTIWAWKTRSYWKFLVNSFLLGE